MRVSLAVVVFACIAFPFLLRGRRCRGLREVRRFPKPVLLSGSPCRRDVQMQHDDAGGVLTGNAVARLAVAVNDFFTEEAEALHGIAITFASGYSVFPEANHADFRTQGFGVLNRPAQVCGFECKHFSCLRF